MPRLNDLGEEEEADILQTSRRKARRLFDGFIDFALQGNILEIAFGLILAATFTTLVSSFVSDVLLPPLSIILPLNKNLEEKFAVLHPGPNYDRELGYNTLKRAQDDGAVVMAYGIFLNQVVKFMGIGLALYGLAGMYQWLSHDPIIKHTVKCRYCRKSINEKAKRCVNCTSWLDGREDMRMYPDFEPSQPESRDPRDTQSSLNVTPAPQSLYGQRDATD